MHIRGFFRTTTRWMAMDRRVYTQAMRRLLAKLAAYNRWLDDHSMALTRHLASQTAMFLLFLILGVGEVRVFIAMCRVERHLPQSPGFVLMKWVALAMGVVFIVFPSIKLVRIWRIYRRRTHGLCMHCGYDLRATPDRCPECGNTPGSPPPAA